MDRKYKDSGIYKITNSTNNKVYIGSSINVYRRYNEHRRELLKGTHCNSHLQRSFVMYGRESFKFSVIIRGINPDNLLGLERNEIIKQNSINEAFGYNQILPEANGKRRQFSDIVKEKSRRTMLAKNGIITDEQYQVWKDNKEAKRIHKLLNPMKKTPIVVLLKTTGKYIAKYNTINEAARALNIENKKISDVVHGRRLSVAGYLFMNELNYNKTKDYSIVGNPGSRKPYYKFELNGELAFKHDKIDLINSGYSCEKASYHISIKTTYMGYLWSRSPVIDIRDFNIPSEVDRTAIARATSMKRRKYDVLVYDLDDNFIAEYNLPIEASESLGVRYGSIKRVLAGKRNMTHGYKFVKRLLKPI